MISFNSFVASQLGIFLMQKQLFMDAIGEIFISSKRRLNAFNFVIRAPQKQFGMTKTEWRAVSGVRRVNL